MWKLQLCFGKNKENGFAAQKRHNLKVWLKKVKGKQNKSLNDQYYLLLLGLPCVFFNVSTWPSSSHDISHGLTDDKVLSSKKCNALSQEKASRGVGRVLCVTCAALLPLFAHYHCSNLFVFQLKRGVCKNPNPSSKQNPYLMSYFFASLPLCQFHINTLSHQHLKPSKA